MSSKRCASARATISRAVWMYIAGRAKVYAGCDEEAVVWLNRSIQLNPNTPVFHFMLAAALAHLGRIEDAREAARAGLRLDPTSPARGFGDP